MPSLVAYLTFTLLFFTAGFSGDAHLVRADAGAEIDAGQPAVADAFFDPSVVRPSNASNEQQILAALRGDDRKRAYQLALVALEHATKSLEGRLHWLAAKAAADDKKALYHLSVLGESDHPLAPWARLRQAELLSKTDPKSAERICQTLMDSWVGRKRARRIRALALIDSARAEQAVPILRALINQASPSQSAASEAMPLADYLASKSSIEARQEALELYRRVASRAPAAKSGIEADAKAREILVTLPVRIQRKLAAAPIDDIFYKGRALFRIRKYAEAASVFQTIAKQTKTVDPGQYCRARLEQGKALLRQRKRKEGARLLSSAAARCPDNDARAWARFFAAQALVRTAEPQAAIAQYRAIERETPTHSLADDAAFHAALAIKDAGNETRMVQWLNELPKKYPHGDMRAKARFTLIQSARKQRDWDEALRQLDLLIAEGPDEDIEGMRGRALYWRARTLCDLGRISEAVVQYEEVVAKGPLDYYAQQALVRLAEIDSSTVNRILLELEDNQEKPPLVFVKRPEMGHPAFKRAVELFRVAEIDLAKQELGWTGALGDKADTDMLWLVAAMFDHAGAYVESTNLARRRLRAFMTTAPKGKSWAKWRIAYPRAFQPLIESVGKQFGIPTAFIRAVAREESGFDPTAVSSANAYGLIQLIAPTARRYASELGLPSDPAALARPEVNLPIGVNFIRSLWRRYETNPSVVPAAYNAGEGAADRWLKESREQHLDEWIEAIPYAETRRYTRRVLQTYGVYAWLDIGRLPPLPTLLPQR
ncbi:MAG: transglycosylase SLT domain-containing protein [Deltaproteobacteria bacterium]|nr:transglycosylase SLT domain-containing protein [Deltaproteobacteria bacterium]